MTLEEMLALIEGILTNPDATPEEMVAAVTQVRDALAALVSAEGEAEGEEAAQELSQDELAKVADGLKSLQTRIDAAKKEAGKKANALLADVRANVGRGNPLPLDNGNKRGKSMTLPAAVAGMKSKHYGSNEDAYKVAQFFRALNGNQKAASWLKEHGYDFEEKALTSADNSSAGILVPEEMESAILKLRDEYGVARSLASVATMTSETKSNKKLISGVTGYLINEGVAIPSSDPVYAMNRLTAKLWGARTEYYGTLSDDSAIALVDEITEEHGYAHAQKEDEVYFLGDGTSTYGGIVGVTYKHRKVLEDGGGTWATDADKAKLGSALVATGATWASITDDDISKLMAKVRGNTTNLKFTCTSAFYWEVLHVLAMNAGGTTATEVVNGVSRPVFYGVPVVFNEAMAATSAADQVPLLLGDFATGSTLGDRKGITLETDKTISTQVHEVVTTTRWDVLIHDAGNYHATAASRTRGSIAALITKNS